MMEKPIIWTVAVSRLYYFEISALNLVNKRNHPLNLGFEQAVEAVHQRLQGGHCDAIISAGSNGAYLKSHVSVPVIIVKISGFDVMQALAKAREISDKVRIINYKKTLSSLDEFQQRFGLQIEQHELCHRRRCKISA